MRPIVLCLLISSSVLGAFPETSVLDDFNRDNEGPPPSASWTNVDNGLKVVSNAVEGDTGAGNWSNYNVSTYGSDCECYITLGVDMQAVNVYARLSAVDSEDDGYRVTSYDDEVLIYRLDDGVATQLGTEVSQAYASGDQLGIECKGSNISSYYNDGGSGWGVLDTQVDATYDAAGYIGMRIYNDNKPCDNFGGGTVEEAPSGGGQVIVIIMSHIGWPIGLILFITLCFQWLGRESDSKK